MMRGRVFWLIAVAVLVLVIGTGGWLANKVYIDRSVAQLGERLELYSILRKGALEQYFATGEAELRFWSMNSGLQDKLVFLNESWQRVVAQGEDPEQKLQHWYVRTNPFPYGERRKLLDAGDGSPYSALHGELHPMAELFVLERGYYDFFLIGAQGDIYYSVEKEGDFATNLMRDEWKETGLADAFRQAMQYAADGEDRVAVSDIGFYQPSGDAAAIFMAKAMTNSQGELIGALAFQLPMDQIEEIMRYGENLTDTGELFTVGEDRMMRSNSRFSDEQTILLTQVDTPTVDLAFQGKAGSQITTDYRGVQVISAYSLVEIDRNRWAVMAELDLSEAEAISANRRPALAGLMLFLYGLGLWTAWYGRSTDFNAESVAMPDIDFDPDIGNV